MIYIFSHLFCVSQKTSRRYEDILNYEFIHSTSQNMHPLQNLFKTCFSVISEKFKKRGYCLSRCSLNHSTKSGKSASGRKPAFCGSSGMSQVSM